MGIIAGLGCLLAAMCLWWIDAEVAIGDATVQGMIHGGWIVMSVMGLIFVIVSIWQKRYFR